jgi:dipeptidyl aminopeptidase/acylaminoacyl peptidase
MNFGKEGVFSFDNPLLKSAFGKAFIDDEKSAKRDDMIKMGQTLSPINFITDKMPPTMLVHGDKDMLVPLQQSQIAIAKLESLKIKCKLEVVPGGGHGWANMIPQLNQLMDWFEETLK